ncbi:MAG: hypothetical protein ACI97A_001870 [Planctomycetota bacterium]|jgi:hypothetical protein
MATAKRRKKRKGQNRIGRISLILIPVVAVGWGFALPWLDYRCAGLNEFLLGCPPTQLVEGWRLPLFAHDAEQAWVVRVAQIFRSDEPDRSLAWLIYASPLAAFLCLGLLQSRRRGVLRVLVGAANAIVLFFLIQRLQEPMPQPPLVGLEVKLGIGILLSAVGHALACWAALVAVRPS